MTRPLGSFNRRVNLPSHPEDTQGARPARIAGLKPEMVPPDRGGTTGGEKFSQGRGRSGRQEPENRRFAGAIMNIDLSTGVTPAPWEITDSLNYGQEGTVSPLYSRPAGEYYTKANSDLSQRVLGTSTTGQDVHITSGLQAAFAPSLAGAAETRKTAATGNLPDLLVYKK